MRTSAGSRHGAWTVALLVLVACAAAPAPAPARAQAPEALLTTEGPVWVDTRWIEGQPRRAEVDLVLGARRVRAFEGRTVRTTAAARGSVVAVGYYHGGPEPFAGVVLVDLVTGARHEARLPLAGGASSPLRPAALVLAAVADGFALVLQEQQPDPSADVASTFARVGVDGVWSLPPRRAAIPWGLAALGGGVDGELELAVLFGGWGQGTPGHARICLVSLSAEGAPREHPWWASPPVALTDVRIGRSAQGLELFYRTADGEVLHARFAQDGRWGREPPAAALALHLRPAQTFYLRPSDDALEAVALDP